MCNQYNNKVFPSQTIVFFIWLAYGHDKNRNDNCKNVTQLWLGNPHLQVGIGKISYNHLMVMIRIDMY
jgi:hypothetical protein